MTAVRFRLALADLHAARADLRRAALREFLNASKNT